MNESRLDALRSLHERDPADPFVAYALALELAKRPESAPEARGTFAALIASRPDYVPAYYQYGLFLHHRGETEEARRILTAGIAAAARAGDGHAQGELEAALAGL